MLHQEPGHDQVFGVVWGFLAAPPSSLLLAVPLLPPSSPRCPLFFSSLATHWLLPRASSAVLALLPVSLPPSSKLLGAFQDSSEEAPSVSPCFLPPQPSMGASFHCATVPPALRAPRCTRCCRLRPRALGENNILRYPLFIKIKRTEQSSILFPVGLASPSKSADGQPRDSC